MTRQRGVRSGIVHGPGRRSAARTVPDLTPPAGSESVYTAGKTRYLVAHATPDPGAAGHRPGARMRPQPHPPSLRTLTTRPSRFASTPPAYAASSAPATSTTPITSPPTDRSAACSSGIVRRGTATGASCATCSSARRAASRSNTRWVDCSRPSPNARARSPSVASADFAR